jgi:hypothetical protein
VRSACTYNPLADDVTLTTSSTPAFYQFAQTSAYWSAVAVRPWLNEDWDIAAYSGTAADPTCVSGVLASSTGGVNVLDLVIADFNHTPTGTYYIGVNQYSGSNPAQVQWDDGPDLIGVNGAAVAATLNHSDLIRVYDVFLTAGVNYNFDFYPGGGTGSHMLLFRNTGGGTYWSGRSGAILDLTGPGTLNAPANGYYGVVVTNDLGYNNLTFTLGITTSGSGCGPITTLPDHASFNIAPANAHYAVDYESSYWQGVAILANSGDWDLTMYGQPSGNTSPTCFAAAIGGSTAGAGAVDLVVGDFNTTPFGWSFALPAVFSGAGNCQVQNTGSEGYIGINDDPILYNVTSSTVAQMHDVHLVAGHTYAIYFSIPNPGLTMLLFANTGGGAYFAGRAAAVLSTTTSTTYTAPVTGYYGIAVVNDGATSNAYSLGVGDCSQVTPLANGSFQNGFTRNSYFSFHQTDAYWTAVAVRNTYVDWDLTVNADSVSSPMPACATTPLATSSLVPPAVDFVVGDFNHDAPGTYYVHAHQYTTGSVNPGQVQWDSGPDLILPDSHYGVGRTTSISDLIGCWDVRLTAGQTYQFILGHNGGANLHLLLFRNAGGGTYWANRASAEFSTATTQTYAAPSSGYYGVVVVNDDGTNDDYSIQVETCSPVTALPPPPGSVLSPLNEGAGFVSFNQPNAFWCPVAVRAVLQPLYDWDLTAYSAPNGGPIGTCMNGSLASSAAGFGITDFVVGDFNYVSTGTWYARGEVFVGISQGEFQYFPSSQILPVNGAHQVRTKPADFLVESWDGLLTAGQQYSVFFSHDPDLDAKVCVFPSTGGAFWGGRASAMLETSHSATFTATTSGYYGIVVVNDGGSGTFNIGLNSGTTAVDESPLPERTMLEAISPNPGRAGMRFAYALHEPGAVSFDVVDMLGRIVSRLDPGEKSAGEWSETWAATDGSGQALHPGIYFVRMHAGGQIIGTRKLTLLE